MVKSAGDDATTHASPTPRPAVKEPDLRRQLLERKDQDQRARTAAPFDGERVGSVDALNTEWMKLVVAAYGWPGRSLVGPDGAYAAWLLVQHADRDPDFQAQCLTLMEDAYQNQEVRGDNLAYLTDRVRVNTGQKQVYGTQFWSPPGAGGKMEPRPIEDEEHLDQLRAAMGLGPFSEYRRLMTGEDGK